LKSHWFRSPSGRARGIELTLLSFTRVDRSTPSAGRQRRAAPALLLAAAALLSACSSTIADLPAPIGLPQGAPERPAVEGDYPAVGDMPPARPTVVLTEQERKKAEDELIAARDRQMRRSAR
jgi:hypothetical protein